MSGWVGEEEVKAVHVVVLSTDHQLSTMSNRTADLLHDVLSHKELPAVLRLVARSGELVDDLLVRRTCCSTFDTLERGNLQASPAE